MRRAGRGLRTARACDRRYLRERNRGCSLDGQFAGESAQPVRHGVGSAATLLAIRESSYGGFVRVSRWARAGNSVPKAPLRRGNYCYVRAMVPSLLTQPAGCGGAHGERGLAVDHTTIWRWTQAYAPEVQRPLRGGLKPKGSTWHMDEILCASLAVGGTYFVP